MNSRVVALGVLCSICLVWLVSSQDAGPDFEFAKMLSGVQNISELCNFMGVDDCNKLLKEVEFEDQVGDKVAVSGAEPKIALFDACNPRGQTIAIPRHPNPEIIIWPPCTRAQRCGGCCTSDVFSCEPTETIDTYVKVFDTKLAYPGAQRVKFVGIRNVRLEEHTKCEAQCKTKPHECHQYQKYEHRKCRCECRPERMSLKGTCHPNQRWDDSECDCICPNRATTECPPPFRFSSTTCKCTIKTEVTGEIDLDALIEQFDKNLLQLNRKQEYNPDFVDIASLFKLTGHGKGAGPDEKGAEPDEKEAFGNQIVDQYSTDELPEGKVDELTTSTETTSTTEASTTTTTTEPTTSEMTTTTEDPEPKCSEKITCRRDWVALMVKNGICRCYPPSAARFLMRNKMRTRSLDLI